MIERLTFRGLTSHEPLPLPALSELERALMTLLVEQETPMRPFGIAGSPGACERSFANTDSLIRVQLAAAEVRTRSDGSARRARSATTRSGL